MRIQAMWDRVGLTLSSEAVVSLALTTRWDALERWSMTEVRPAWNKSKELHKLRYSRTIERQ
jgi:hypothetical protein